jgi:hypothetical protein
MSLNRKQRRTLKAIGTPVPLPPPTPEEADGLMKSFATYCAQLGELEYRMAVMEGEADDLREKISQTNQRYSQIPKAPPAPEEAPAAEVTPEAK